MTLRLCSTTGRRHLGPVIEYDYWEKRPRDRGHAPTRYAISSNVALNRPPLSARNRVGKPNARFWPLLLAKWAAASFDLPQTVHVVFMTLKPLFVTVRGNMVSDHGEEKEEERENEDLKRASRIGRTAKFF